MTNADLMADAVDGKVDLVKRFDVDLKTLITRQGPYLAMGDHGDLYKQPPLTDTQMARLSYERGQLQGAALYAWDQAIITRVKQQGAAEKFPRDVPFSRAWLYTPAGVWWFGRRNPQLLLRSATMDPTGGEMRRAGCAVSWWPYLDHPDDVLLWGYSYDHVEPTPGPVPVTHVILRAGQTLHELEHEWLQDQAAAVAVAHSQQERIKGKLRELYPNLDDLVGSQVELAKLAFQHNLISKIDYGQSIQAATKLAWIKSASQLVRFFLAGSLWLQQKVVSFAIGQPGRQARKRAERERIDATTRVVILRRTESQPVQDPGSGTSLNVRILVAEDTGGFWRTQHFTDGPRPIWIEPYWKGPKDAPVKIPAKAIFKVAR